MIPDEESPELNKPDQPQSDDDWKDQVEAEKAAAAEETPQETIEPEPVAVEQSEEAVEEATEVAAEEDPAAGTGQAPPDPMQLPPATFDMLVVTMATQAMALLGQGVGPDDSEPAFNLPLARHHIDLLAMLEEKTEGNRTEEETALLSNLLHQLRLLCVSVESSDQSDPPAGEETAE